MGFDVKNTIAQNEKKQMDFQKLLSKTQKHMSKNCSALIDAIGKKDQNASQQMINLIRQYLLDRNYIAEGLSLNDTVRKLYNELTQFSILDDYLDEKRTDVEEININSWQDVKVRFSDGHIENVEHFRSAEHCENIIRRLLSREADLTLDKSRPLVRGHLNSKVRITVIGGDCVDKAVGLASSIRIVNPKKLGKDDFMRKGTANEEMLMLIEELFLNGASMCITGATGSGKTTLMSYLLSEVPDQKRLFTIEEDVREFNLVRRNEMGEVINNVVHTVTKKSDDPTQSIDQEKLLEMAMTMNPDIVCVAEMKGKEARAAVEAANTGHTVITTTHAKSARATYPRMAVLCKNGNDSEETLERLAKNAFPFIVFMKLYDDNVRRIEEITEYVEEEDGRSHINTLYYFNFKQKYYDEHGMHIEGEYQKRSQLSDKALKMLEEGTTDKSILAMFRKEG